MLHLWVEFAFFKINLIQRKKILTKFIISYLGGDKPSTEQQANKHFQEYQKWLADLGDAVIKPMVPFKNIHLVKPDGSVVQGSSIEMSGQTVVQANSIEDAIAMTKIVIFWK